MIVQAEYLIRVFKDRPYRPRVTAGPEAIPLYHSIPQKENSLQDTVDNSNRHFTGRERVTPNVALMLLGLAIATVFIYIRSIYRTIEVSMI